MLDIVSRPSFFAVSSNGSQNVSDHLGPFVADDAAQVYCELVHAAERSIFMVCKAVLVDESDAGEAAQAAVLRGFDTFMSLQRGGTSPTVWLLQLAIRVARMHLKNNSEHHAETGGTGAYCPRNLADWGSLFDRSRCEPFLGRAFSKLPLQCREALMVRDILQFDLRETAAILGISQQELKADLQRGRLQLCDELTECVLEQ